MNPAVSTPKEDPPVADNLKFEKMARQKARTSLAMRRGTTRVQSPYAVPHPSKVTFVSKKTTLEGHLERHLERSAVGRRAKDEQSVASVETDMHSVISKSETSESKKSRPSRPRRTKKYPPSIFDHPPSPPNGSKARQDGLKRNLEDASVVMQDKVVSHSPLCSPLGYGDLTNVAKRSLEMSSMDAIANLSIQVPSLRQKVKEQQKAHKRQVIQHLIPKEPREPDGSKVEVEPSTPLSQLEQRRSRYTKVSSALQRKRPIACPKATTSIGETAFNDNHIWKQDTSTALLEVTLTASDSASSSNPSPTSESKPEEPTKAVSRMAVLTAARRTKIQNSPSKNPDGTLLAVDSEASTTSYGRLSVYATPTRNKSRTDRMDTTSVNSFTRSLDIDKRRSLKFHGTSPSSSSFVSFASRPDPPSERVPFAVASPSVTRGAALQRLSIDPALKRFQHPGRNSTGSVLNGKGDENIPHYSNSTERSNAPGRGQESPCPSRVPSLQATFSSHSEESISSYPKIAVGNVAVGDLIDVFLSQSANKSSNALKASRTKTSQSSFKPDSGSRISESGKASRNRKLLARGSEKAKKSLQANGARKVTEPSQTKHATDPFGKQLPALTISTAWEAFT